MINFIKKYTVLGLVFTFNLIGIKTASSQISNTPKPKSYQILEDKFRAGKPAYKKTAFYAHQYLKNAKKEENPIRIAEAYYLLCLIDRKSPVVLAYTDSIIETTKSINDDIFPAKGYFFRGFYYDAQGNYRKALENYELAYAYALKRKNYAQLSDVMYNIGILRNTIGEYQEALIDFKRFFEFINARNRIHRYKGYKEDHLLVLFALAETYNLNNKLDSAHMYTVKGINVSKAYKNVLYYNNFVMTSGITSYLKKDYKTAIDSLRKAIPYIRKIKKIENLALCHIYMGRSYYGLNHLDKAMQSFHTADSLITNTSLEILLEFRQFYDFLIQHYRKNNDQTHQLVYINRLLEVDSILDVKYKYLTKTVSKKFETPRLLSEKQTIIDTLKKREKSTYGYLYILLLLTVSAVGFAIYRYRREQSFKQKFLELLEHSKYSKKTPPIHNPKVKTGATDVPEKVADDILKKLRAFEEKSLYLKKNLTQNKIAQKLNTNSSYLSKVVNAYKHKNFATYINDLRIEYVVKRLQEDKKLRSYTIKTIADEIGFNNAESFTKAFYKKTRIKPSYYIKKLNINTIK